MEEKNNPYLRMRALKDNPNRKTAILVNEDIVPKDISSDEVQLVLKQKIDTIPGNRPIQKIGPPSNSPTKRPASVLTPNGTELKREKTYGALLFYSNEEVTEVSRNLPLSIKELPSEVLKPANERDLFQEMYLDEKLLEKINKERAGQKRGTNGIPDQNQCMVRKGVNKREASATKNANKLGISEPGELWEWLHLIAFMLKGRAGQDVKNLTGGTKHANTDMMFPEGEITYLIEQLGEVYLHVAANEIPGTHYAKEIKYTVITKNFVLPFVFNAQTSIQPSIRNKTYVHALVETMIELTKEMIQGTRKKRKLDFSTEEKKSNLFFSVDKLSDTLSENESIKLAENESQSKSSQKNECF